METAEVLCHMSCFGSLGRKESLKTHVGSSEIRGEGGMGKRLFSPLSGLKILSLFGRAVLRLRPSRDHSRLCIRINLKVRVLILLVGVTRERLTQV